MSPDFSFFQALCSHLNLSPVLRCASLLPSKAHLHQLAEVEIDLLIVLLVKLVHKIILYAAPLVEIEVVHQVKDARPEILALEEPQQ